MDASGGASESRNESDSGVAHPEVTRLKQEAGEAYRACEYAVAQERYTAALDMLDETVRDARAAPLLRAALLVNRAMAQLQMRTQCDSRRARERNELCLLYTSPSPRD